MCKYVLELMEYSTCVELESRIEPKKKRIEPRIKNWSGEENQELRAVKMFIQNHLQQNEESKEMLGDSAAALNQQ